MSTLTSDNVSNLVDQTTRMFETAVQCGIDMQQASTRWVMNALGDPRLFEAWQKQHQAVVMAAMDTGRHSMDTMLDLLSQNTRLGLGLMQQTWKTGQKEFQKTMTPETHA